MDRFREPDLGSSEFKAEPYEHWMLLRDLAPVPAELQMTDVDRLPEPVEVAAYYVVAEALTNAAKHAHASVVRIAVDMDDSCLRLVIRDDGVGGADHSRGSGLIGLQDPPRRARRQ